MEILLANPRGFCAGVDRAIEIVNRAIEVFGAPIYVRHEVVHNKFVVDGLREKGAVFVEHIAEIPENSICIFSAHGVSQRVKAEAEKRNLKVFDATCPLVTKVHMEVVRASRREEECILIGHKGHPEVEGTMGQYGANPQQTNDASENGIYLVETVADVQALTVKNPQQLHFVTQTTLSVDDTKQIIAALQEKFPQIQGPKKDDICYATQNRQDAVRALAADVDVVLVVGSQNSSNSNRLRELAEKQGIAAYLVDNAEEINAQWLAQAKKVGVTAGASAPEVLVQQVIARLEALGGHTAAEVAGKPEDIVFVLPPELR
ncbi:MAG: 4-hydroxy-3-methylbut-2-enyl diphosphate reductase [Gammaproteobacteria bacterium]|nr:4-hydroxy-3-methylbut-2-enyl diphosphate reductase [Gammaproteobacteria bacterium]